MIRTIVALCLALLLLGLGEAYWFCKRPLAPSGGLYFWRPVHLGVIPFRQNDPRWGRDLIGRRGDTLGAQGCAVTSAAAILASYGVALTPQTLNQFLNTHGGYTPEGWLIWEKAAAFQPGVAEKSYEDDASYYLIDSSLMRGVPVIVRLKLRSGRTHFVVIMGKEGWDYLICDPGAGASKGFYPLRQIGSQIYALRAYRRL
ncbi:MAG: C39 family peptidase [Verrucomicrobium sp.]|nr:C39 family peptidase [Verrucomicrobium sp.]